MYEIYFFFMLQYSKVTFLYKKTQKNIQKVASRPPKNPDFWVAFFLNRIIIQRNIEKLQILKYLVFKMDNPVFLLGRFLDDFGPN